MDIPFIHPSISADSHSPGQRLHGQVGCNELGISVIKSFFLPFLQSVVYLPSGYD